MFCDCMNALKVFGLSLGLLGQPMMAHFERFKSLCDHYAKFCILSICGWICCRLSIMIAILSAYAGVVHMEGDVLK